jgi:hypothetical protein
MPGLTVNVLLQDIKKIEAEAVIVGFYEDIRPLKHLAGELDWLLCGSLSNLIIKHKFQGALGDVALLTTQGKLPAQKIFLVGLGPKEKFSSQSLTAAARTALASVIHAGVKNAAIECFSAAEISYDTSVPALKRGMTEAAAGKDVHVSLLAPDANVYDKLSRLARA